MALEAFAPILMVENASTFKGAAACLLNLPPWLRQLQSTNISARRSANQHWKAVARAEGLNLLPWR
jgi:hypothetical protein